VADPRRIIEALLSKTVANGCTPEEAASSLAKARELSEKYGVPLEQPRPTTFTFRVDPDFAANVDEMLRRAMREAVKEMQRRRAAQGRSGKKPGDDQYKRESYKTVRDCAEHFLHPRWRTRDDKPLTNRQVAEVVRGIMGSETTEASVAWYRNRMKKEGRL